ncbi:MAG: hypothetical protein Q9196_004966 [Gyalolechia fulgens]
MNGVLLAGYYMPFDPATAEATKADMARRVGVSRWEDLDVPLGSEQRKKMVAGFEAALGSGLASWFVRHDEGPFLEGNTPMYADLIIGGWLRMMKNCLPEWEKLKGWHEGLWGRLHDALEEWGTTGAKGQRNQRGTVDILQSCLSTIFISLWVMLHLNVPAEHEAFWTSFFRKTRWLILGALAPETVLLASGGQWASARDP